MTTTTYAPRLIVRRRGLSLIAGLLAFLVLLPATAWAADEAPAPDRDSAWKTWQDLFAQRSKGLKPHKFAMVELAKLADRFPDDYEIQWQCARAFYYFSERYQKEQEDLIRAAKMSRFGARCGDRAMKVDPKGFEGRYWRLTNWVRVKASEGEVKALAEAKTVKGILEKLIADHPMRVEAFMMLGGMYRVLPGFPVSFGDAKKGLELLLEGQTKEGPKHELLIEIAEAYVVLGDKAKAIEFYGKAATVPGYPGMDFEELDAHTYAEKRIAELRK
jgi:tetratricopeptide (TPR) repeat protein